MYPLLPWFHTNLVLAFAAALTILAAPIYDAALPRSRRFWIALVLLCLPVLLGQVLWHAESPQLSARGVELSWTVLPLLVLGSLGFALAAPVRRLLGFVATRRERARRSARSGARREFLRQAVTLLPASAMAAGATAMAGNDTTSIVHVPLRFRDLPPELEGLRILHLSDLHLGAGRTVADLREILGSLAANPPDLVVFTGDVADKLEELGPALEAACELGPRLGVYAALGNHEYLNDIAQMRPVYERSRAQLLVNQGASLHVAGRELFIAGVDDPVFAGNAASFYEQAVAKCAETAQGSAFRLLLCHRPDGFEAAARHGFHLTLSGHTHGGQVGLWGRSAFERLFGVPYLWGKYRRGQSQLYTTSGFGHWFPFRLNCPAEAPLIVLQREGG